MLGGDFVERQRAKDFDHFTWNELRKQSFFLFMKEYISFRISLLCHFQSIPTFTAFAQSQVEVLRQQHNSQIKINTIYVYI